MRQTYYDSQPEEKVVSEHIYFKRLREKKEEIR
jgi:hypothetical protein